MPCYQIITATVSFKVANKELLIDAIKQVGYKYVIEGSKIILSTGLTPHTIDLKNETITGDQQDYRNINRLKRTYSELVIKTIATKNKWILKNAGNKHQLRRY